MTSHREQAINDLAQIRADLSKLPADRILACLAGIDSHAPDGYRRRASGNYEPDEPAPIPPCQGWLEAANGERVKCTNLRPCPHHDTPNDYPLNPVEAAAIGSDPTTRARRSVEQAWEHARLAIAHALVETIRAERAFPLDQIAAREADKAKARLECKRCGAIANTVVHDGHDTGEPAIYRLADGIDAQLCERCRAEAYRCEMPDCGAKAETQPNGRPKMWTVGGARMQLCTGHRHSMQAAS